MMDLNSDERQSFNMFNITQNDTFLLLSSDNINVTYMIEFFVGNVQFQIQRSVNGCFVNSHIAALKATTWCIRLHLWKYSSILDFLSNSVALESIQTWPIVLSRPPCSHTQSHMFSHCNKLLQISKLYVKRMTTHRMSHV